MIRAVLDPGVLVAALLSSQGAPAQLLRLLVKGHFQLVLSPKLLEEAEQVVTTPRTKVRGFSGSPPKAPSGPRKTLTPYRQASAMLLALPRVFVWSFTHRTTRWNPLLQVSRSTGNFVPKNIVPNPCPPVVDVGELSSLRSHVAARYALRDR
ncbi:PIN domain-containing protein [Thermus scotoductus]|uniref:PIN domain-containing protein n=1 Tax=Thermus scotoductus TaxID=37636 RepID=UPI0020A484C8|nr:PIN domain-containing protein [Thermus scotoductus]